MQDRIGMATAKRNRVLGGSEPLLIINFKNYSEIGGDRALRLAKTAEEIANALKVKIAVAPPNVTLAYVANSVKIPVFAQHLDSSELGSTTGFSVPDLVKSYGVSGSIVNHSEHRIPKQMIGDVISKLRELGMLSVVCAKTPTEVKKLAAFDPDMIAIEPPELIGSGVAVSKAKPGVITRSVDAVNEVNKKVSVVCGAGIVSGEDVAAALRLGSKGVLVASGIVKAKNWKAKIRELAAPLKK